MDADEMSRWYNGYRFTNVTAVYSPRSAVEAILRQKFGTYRNQTESYEALKIYIQMNYDGLRDSIVRLLAGEAISIDARSFTNDMVTFETADDVMTLLIHLGYLGYLEETEEVFIPNKEISDEFVTAIRVAGWDEVIRAVKASADLLKATWRGDEETVASYVEAAHNETAHIKYSDENALSCVISLAYYSARQFYDIVREMPAGKGLADLIFLPKKNHRDKPAMIVELKWNWSDGRVRPGGALRQIENRQYTEALQDYKDTLLLVGINYDKDTKQHQCNIKKATV